MAQSVVVKKKEKQANVLAHMTNRSDPAEFARLFKEMYPNDWKRIQSRYAKEERKDTKGKGHPMPPPEIYLRNMYNVALKAHNASTKV